MKSPRLLLLALPSAACFTSPSLVARSCSRRALTTTMADQESTTTPEDERMLRRRLFVEREPERPLETAYSAAAGALAALSFYAAPDISTSWVLLSMAVALLCDFGPSARRDMRSSVAASDSAVNEYIDATPQVRLVDNFVVNPGSPDLVTRGRKETASDKLAASQRWALLVRARVAGDAAGVALMLSGRACLGAALLLAAHSAFWASGAAAARVDACANPSPLSPPLARLIQAATLGLAATAAVGGLGPHARLRAAGGRAFAALLLAIQAARLTADRVRARIHVGL